MLGWVMDPHPMIQLIRDLRRLASIDQDTSVYMDQESQEIRIECSSERLMRPLLVVEKFGELEKLSSELHLYSLHDLCVRGFVEFVDAWESNNLTIAFTEKVFFLFTKLFVSMKSLIEGSIKSCETRYSMLTHGNRSMFHVWVVNWIDSISRI